MSSIEWVYVDGGRHAYALKAGHGVSQVNEALNGDGFMAMVTEGASVSATCRVKTMTEGKQWVEDQLALRRLRGAGV